MGNISRTIVLSCAGLGKRLGLGLTKALLQVDGKSLIIRHLEALKDEDDIRIVVGYQAEKVIEEVTAYRKDVTFVFNHNYKSTGTGGSVALAAKYANEYILTIDGDIIINPDDMKNILKADYEFVSGGVIESDDPWMLQTFNENNQTMVSAFSKSKGQYEWNGISQMKSEKMLNGVGHVFQSIEAYLPVRYLPVRTREIDTMDDYDRAVSWVENGFKD